MLPTEYLAFSALLHNFLLSARNFVCCYLHLGFKPLSFEATRLNVEYGEYSVEKLEVIVF